MHAPGGHGGYPPGYYGQGHGEKKRYTSEL